jgi:NADPH:quinone reductase-like Zn-dependent oxidoreductase
VKAAAFFEYGPAGAMRYADIPDPVLGPGDVLVGVQACGVNHSDLESRAGTSRWSFELPMVLGAEFTGTVVGVGGDLFGAHLSVLREEGTLVTCGAHAGEVVPLDLVPLLRNGWRIVGFRVAPPDELATSLKLIRSGSIKVPIAATFLVSDAAAAHCFLERRQHVGKVLLAAE